MSLELKPGSQWWYGRVTTGGKAKLIALRIKVEGQRPASLREQGDAKFERARAFAEAKLKETIKELSEPEDELKLLHRIHRLKTGIKIDAIALSAMAEQHCVTILRRKPLSVLWQTQIHSVASDFEAFCAKLASPITKMGGVSVRVAQEFAKHEQLLGNSPKTFNNRMDVLRAIFQSLGSRAGLAMNPFDGKSIPRMDTKASTISHRPYTLEEIERIMHTLADEDFIRPIVITALCTAMRRINCCLLRYEDVIWSEKEKRIKVLPAKGGDRVSIPIFPLLERELAPAMKRHEGKKEDFVFPGQAAMYKSNPDGITLRVKKALKKAGFAETEDENGDASKALTVRRQVGRRRASIRGTHSCRTTWITLAFSGGMSVEEIQVITGQKSAEVIVGAYNRPGDELIRKTLEQSLPKALTGCMNTEVVIDNTARVTGLLSAMTDGNWQNLRDEALRLLNNNNL